MFPETFVTKHLAASHFDGLVFDPFCGRGTTIFESLLHGREAAGCDVHPVAVCVSGAKSDSPTRTEVLDRLSSLETESRSFQAEHYSGDLAEFFELCYAPDTYDQVCFLRERLDWQGDRIDRFIAALSMGALHGESHRSPSYFSNRLPRTISTKPAYSVRWWRAHGYVPPSRDVFAILRRLADYRFTSNPPPLRGEVALSDARNAASTFHLLTGQITDIITSPPYLDTTNYREDQWLRLWLLGGEATANHHRGDDRHGSADKYQTFLTEAWAGVRPLLANEARIVVRIGGRKLTRDGVMEILLNSLTSGLQRPFRLVGAINSSRVRRTQAISFRNSRPSPATEHDFCFFVR